MGLDLSQMSANWRSKKKGIHLPFRSSLISVPLNNSSLNSQRTKSKKRGFYFSHKINHIV